MEASSASNPSLRIPTFSNPRSIVLPRGPGYSIDVDWTHIDPSQPRLLDREHEFLNTCSTNEPFGQALNSDDNLKTHARRTFYWVSEVNRDITAEELSDRLDIDALNFRIGDYNSSLGPSPSSDAGGLVLTISVDPADDSPDVYLPNGPSNSPDHLWCIIMVRKDVEQGPAKYGYRSLGPEPDEATDSGEPTLGYSYLICGLRILSPSMDAKFSRIDAALTYCLPTPPSNNSDLPVELEISMGDGFLGVISALKEEDDMPDKTDWVATV